MMLIGLDIGTTSICGVLANRDNKEILKSVTRDNTAGLASPHSWERIQDADAIVRIVKDILTALSRSEEPAAAIGITGQMHGIVYVNDEGDAVSPLFTWQDQRGGLPDAEGVSHTMRLSRLTGYAAAAGYGMVTHYYNMRNGLVPPGAAAFCTIGDYVAMRLAGRTRPVTDVTHSASLGLFDLKSLAFDEKALHAAGIDPALLPETAASGSVIGRTEDGIPVCCALGDNQASFLGSVPDIHGSMLLNIGTGSQISAYTDEFVQIEGLETRPYAGGGYLLVGASLSGGKSYAMLERFFREVCRQFGRSPAPEGGLYQIMNRLAQEMPDSIPPLHVDTRFYGSRSETGRHGIIGHITPENFTPQHLVAGVLDGMVRELREFYDRFPPALRNGIRTFIASGNGVRQNAALQAKLEKEFGMPLRMPPGREEASVGAALCAAAGLGRAQQHDHITL